MTAKELTDIFLHMSYEENPPLMFRDKEGNEWQILTIYFHSSGIDIECQRRTIDQSGKTIHPCKTFTIYRYFPEDNEGEFVFKK